MSPNEGVNEPDRVENGGRRLVDTISDSAGQPARAAAVPACGRIHRDIVPRNTA